MGRWVLTLFAITGCDTVFGLNELYECPPNDDDCDRLLDDKDPCPADPTTDPKLVADEDGDGVGDACDPNLSLLGDVISQFDGFATPNEAWLPLAGTAVWSTHDSALAQDDIADGAIQRVIDTAIQPTLEVFVDVEFAGENSAVGVFVATPVMVPLECRIVHHATGDALLLLVNNTPLANHVVTGLPGKVSDGLRVYGGQLPDGTIRCRARYGEADALFVDLTDPIWKPVITPRATIDRVGVRTVQASAQVRAVAVYSVP